MNPKLWFLLGCSLALAVACTPSDGKDEPDRKPPFELSEALVRDLKLDTARSEIVKSELQLTGRIVPYENRLTKVAPLVDGVIEKLSAGLGDYVRKGQVIAVLRSADVADVENQLIQAKSDLLSAQKNLSVTQDLAKSGLAADKDVVLAENDLKKAESALAKSQTVSGIYGIRNSLYTVRAPISGFVVDKNPNISEQMQYHEGETGPFFTIADLSTVQVVANVYESDIANIKPGYEAQVRLMAYPDQVLIGRIDKVNNVLDPTTRTMQVRISLPNSGNRLKPEMFAQVTVQFDGVNRLVTVPSNSLIFDKNKNFVLVYHDPRHIETREVQVAQNADGKAYIAGGLKVGDVVMVKNQLLVYNALNN